MDILKPVLDVLGRSKEADLHRISTDTGVPFGTLLKIKYRQTVNPGVTTVQKLYRHLVERSAN